MDLLRGMKLREISVGKDSSDSLLLCYIRNMYHTEGSTMQQKIAGAYVDTEMMSRNTYRGLRTKQRELVCKTVEIEI